MTLLSAFLRVLSVVLLVALLAGCDSPEPPDSARTSPEPAAPVPEDAPPQKTRSDSRAQDRFWKHLSSHCGKLYGGDMVTDDPRDWDFVGWALFIEFRHCTEQRIEIPFRVGEDTSRTWVLTRTDQGLRFQHERRLEDGSPAAISGYGGTTKDPGTATYQSFPADDDSQQLFEEDYRIAEMASLWALEITPGSRLVYTRRQPGRYFRADFDLENPIPIPADWHR